MDKPPSKPILPDPAIQSMKRGGGEGDAGLLSSSPPRHMHENNGRGEGGREGRHGKDDRKDGGKGDGQKGKRDSFDADHGIFAPAKAVGRRNQASGKRSVRSDLETVAHAAKDIAGCEVFGLLNLWYGGSRKLGARRSGRGGTRRSS